MEYKHFNLHPEKINVPITIDPKRYSYQEKYEGKLLRDIAENYRNELNRVDPLSIIFQSQIGVDWQDETKVVEFGYEVPASWYQHLKLNIVQKFKFLNKLIKPKMEKRIVSREYRCELTIVVNDEILNDKEKHVFITNEPHERLRRK